MSNKLSSNTIIKLTIEDVPRLYYIETQAHRHPMSQNNLLTCFGSLYHNLGLIINGVLVGFAIIHQVVDEVTLIDICISPNVQSSGLGKLLMHEVVETANNRNARFIQLEVRASNNSAIRLYQKMGFSELGQRENYYPTAEGRENAILMTLHINSQK